MSAAALMVMPEQTASRAGGLEKKEYVGKVTKVVIDGVNSFIVIARGNKGELVWAHTYASRANTRTFEETDLKVEEDGCPDFVGKTRKVTIQGQSYFVTVALTPSTNQVALILIHTTKIGSFQKDMHVAFSESVNIGLKHGAPAEEYCALFNARVNDALMPTGYEDVPKVTSIFDFISQWLKIEFFPQIQSGHTPGTPS